MWAESRGGLTWDVNSRSFAMKTDQCIVWRIDRTIIVGTTWKGVDKHWLLLEPSGEDACTESKNIFGNVLFLLLLSFVNVTY